MLLLVSHACCACSDGAWPIRLQRLLATPRSTPRAKGPITPHLQEVHQPLDLLWHPWFDPTQALPIAEVVTRAPQAIAAVACCLSRPTEPQFPNLLCELLHPGCCRCCWQWRRLQALLQQLLPLSIQLLHSNDRAVTTRQQPAQDRRRTESTR